MNKEYEYCLRCGRKLKNEKARLIGYGEICLKKLEHNKYKPLFDIRRAKMLTLRIIEKTVAQNIIFEKPIKEIIRMYPTKDAIIIECVDNTIKSFPSKKIDIVLQ